MRYHKANYLPVIYALLILWAIHVLTSCNATKQAANHLNKAFKKDRIYVAKVTRDSFPCTELLRTDTVTQLTDSIIYIECPESNPQDYISSSEIPNSSDHIAEVGKLVRVPVHIPIRTQVVNHYFEDSAKILLTKNDLSKSVKLIGQMRNQITEKDGKIKRRGKLIFWLIVAITGLTATNILTVRKLFFNTKL